jgi:hypothetical protein
MVECLSQTPEPLDSLRTPGFLLRHFTRRGRWRCPAGELASPRRAPVGALGQESQTAIRGSRLQGGRPRVCHRDQDAPIKSGNSAGLGGDRSGQGSVERLPKAPRRFRKCRSATRRAAGRRAWAMMIRRMQSVATCEGPRRRCRVRGCVRPKSLAGSGRRESEARGSARCATVVSSRCQPSTTPSG